MPLSSVLYKITAAVDWRSTLYIEGGRAQWGIFLAGTVNSTTFEITTTQTGQLPDPLITKTWAPNYTGGLAIPGAVNTSDAYDFGTPLPVPSVTQNVTYAFTKVSGRDNVTWIAPSAANNYKVTIQYDDPDPGAGVYVVTLWVTVNPII
jgi:hypothetical protein